MHPTGDGVGGRHDGYEPLTVLTPMPQPWPIGSGHDRHDPSADALRRQLQLWSEQVDWSKLDWIDLIEALIAAGRSDIPLARLIEGHIDAVRILDQAGRLPRAGALYGVWASRSRHSGIAAESTADGLVLNGTLRFASGAGVLERALVPAWLDDDHHLLLDLGVTELEVDTTGWATAAMEVSRSHTVVLHDQLVPVTSQVGETDFYLGRPAFFPGGVGVAACWLGAAARIVDLLLCWLRPPLPTSMELRLGRIRVALAAGGAAIRCGAEILDQLLPVTVPPAEVGGSGDHLQQLSTEVRAVVGSSVETILTEAHRLAGPAGLAGDRDLSRAVHDLQLYVLQQNADGDAGYLGHGWC